MLAQVVKERLDAEQADGAFLSLVRFLQILDSPVMLVKTMRGDSKTERRHITLFRQRLQFAALLHRLLALISPRVLICQQRQRVGKAGSQFMRRAEGFNSFEKTPHASIGKSDVHMRHQRARVQADARAQVLYGVFKPVGPVKMFAVVAFREDRKRIQDMGQAVFEDGVFMPPGLAKKEAVLHMPRGTMWVQIEGPGEETARLFPIPVMPSRDAGQGIPRFGEAWIELQRSLCGGSCLGMRYSGRNGAAIAKPQPSLSQSGVGCGVGGA